MTSSRTSDAVCPCPVLAVLRNDDFAWYFSSFRHKLTILIYMMNVFCIFDDAYALTSETLFALSQLNFNSPIFGRLETAEVAIGSRHIFLYKNIWCWDQTKRRDISFTVKTKKLDGPRTVRPYITQRTTYSTTTVHRSRYLLDFGSKLPTNGVAHSSSQTTWLTMKDRVASKAPNVSCDLIAPFLSCVNRTMCV